MSNIIINGKEYKLVLIGERQMQEWSRAGWRKGEGADDVCFIGVDLAPDCDK